MKKLKTFLATGLALSLAIPMIAMANKESASSISTSNLGGVASMVNLSNGQDSKGEEQYRIPVGSSAEMEDAYKIATLHTMLSELTDLYESTEDFSGWEEEEIITWDTMNGELRSNKEDSSLLNYIIHETEFSLYTSDFETSAFSEWGQNLDVSFHIVQKPEGYSSMDWYSVDRDCIIYAPDQVVSELSYCPSDNQGTMVFDSNIWGELKLTLPTDLELYGNDFWSEEGTEEDLFTANELANLLRIALAIHSDPNNIEATSGTSVTWHTTATDGIYVTTDEPEGNSPIRDEIYLTLGENGDSLGLAESDWGKIADITFTVSYVTYDEEFTVPYIYTENESLAYRLGIPTSPDDVGSVPESDPTPSNSEETKYEYYAFYQDITLFSYVMEHSFPLLLDEEGGLSVGDTLTWTLDRENAPEFMVHQQNGTTLQEAVDTAFKDLQYYNYCLPSASQMLETVDVTFEVAESEDGSLFFFTEDPFLSTSLYIPINDKEEYERIDIEKEWMVMMDEDAGEGWWKDHFANNNMKQDVDHLIADELLKITRIITVTMVELPDGVTITWHTDLEEGSEEPRVTVEGDDESLRAEMESELTLIFGEGMLLIPLAESTIVQETPFVFTIQVDENGVPHFLAHDVYWAELLGLDLLES